MREREPRARRRNPFFGRMAMYIVLSKKPRKTNRSRTNRLRAKFKAKQAKRVARMVT